MIRKVKIAVIRCPKEEPHMSKLICDICGTEYPETEDCCPVCSAPRAENVLGADVPKNHDNVKGGRYAAPGADKTN